VKRPDAPFIFNHRHHYAESELPEVHPHARAIRDLVLRECSIDIGSFVGTRRHPSIVMARMIAVRLMRFHTLLSYPQIATCVTPGRGHSSVICMDQRLGAVPAGPAGEALARSHALVPASLGRDCLATSAS
jgi:hypothetical protein